MQLAPGLALHSDMVPPHQQAQLVEWVDNWLAQGREGQLIGKTYQKPPQEWVEAGTEFVAQAALEQCQTAGSLSRSRR